MKPFRHLAVVGGDRRQTAMVHALLKEGFFVSTWGIPACEGAEAVKDWKTAIKEADAILLPLPASRNGVHVTAPLLPTGMEELRLASLAEHTDPKPILGGKLPEHFCKIAEKKGFACIDYYQSENLQLKNALPSAEGAIAIAMQELPVVICDTHIAIVGYGRIGELLADRLRALGAVVTVYARRPEVLTRARLSGHRGIALSKEALSEMDPSTRLIYNTVPSRLFDKTVLQSLPTGVLFIDLASPPGGLSMEEAEACGVRAIWASAIPGRYAPESAGDFLAQTVTEILRTR